jgi:hypothetical protein
MKEGEGEREREERLVVLSPRRTVVKAAFS